MSRPAIYSAKEVLRMVFDSDSDSDDGEMDDGSDMEIDVSCYFTILSKNKLARLRGSSISLECQSVDLSRLSSELTVVTAICFRRGSCNNKRL